MQGKLYDSERKVMEQLWRDGDLSAKALADRLAGEVGWNKNTTYTVIKKCVAKGAIERREPGFVCHALLSRQEAQAQELDELVEKWFEGSEGLLFAALLGRQDLTGEAADALRRLVEQEGEVPK